MRRSSATLVVLALAPFAGFAVTGAPAYAGPAFGVYVTGQGGFAEWDWELDNGLILKPEGDTRAAGVGFVLDTAPGEDKVFNYRFKLGVERMDADFDDGFDETLEMAGVAVTHTFGFRLYGSRIVRLWLGPEVQLGLLGVKFQGQPNIDSALFRFGAGATLGANFRVAERFRIGVETGVHATGYAGVTEDDLGFADGDLTASDRGAHLGVSFLF